MAAGDSKLTICNDALLMLGASEITSFTEGTDSAKICDRLYDDLKKYILSIYPWSFAKVKVQLAQTADTPVTEWRYVYALPANMIGTPKALFTTSNAGSLPRAEFELYYVDQPRLLTNYETVYIDHIADIDESRFPEYFIYMLRHALAADIAEPLTDQITKADYFRALAFGSPTENGRGGLFRQAAQADAQGQRSQTIGNESFDLIEVR
tara:strand:+ start:5238 stop:5864 length:627 start_codon:yes stop_codon:yes gene_type:complete